MTNDLQAALNQQRLRARLAVIGAESKRRQIIAHKLFVGADLPDQTIQAAASRKAAELEKKIRDQDGPPIKQRSEAVRGSADELANKVRRIADLICQEFVAQTAVEDQASYLAYATANSQPDENDPTFSALLDQHLASTADKLASAKTRAADLKAERESIEAQLPALKNIVSERIDALNALLA